MKEKLLNELWAKVFDCLQAEPGPISPDAFALASTCSFFWRIAQNHPSLNAKPRRFYTAVTNFIVHDEKAISVFDKLNIKFSFDGIVKRWNQNPLPASLTYKDCLAMVRKMKNVRQCLIFELHLGSEDVQKIPKTQYYRLRPEAMVSTAIQCVSSIYSAGRPQFLTAVEGSPQEVDRSNVYEPRVFDNPKFSVTKKPLRDIIPNTSGEIIKGDQLSDAEKELFSNDSNPNKIACILL
jgi:hypothetical protein